jgi:NADPH-dependent 2,4-dienoyl-CoA reductase/sulfur reductase-like enzyme
VTALRIETYSEVIAADVVVIGAGPAGIAAACHAAERGLQVVLVDRATKPGGQIWRHREGQTLPRIARYWLDRLRGSGTRVMGRTTVVDIRNDAGGFEVLAESASRPLRIWCANLVIATGAREIFIPFDGWTLPGVMGVGGAQALLKSGASFAGKRVIIAGSGPLLFPVAASLADAGAQLQLVVEQARISAVLGYATTLLKHPGTLLQAVRYRSRFLSTRYTTGAWVVSAHGGDRLRSVSMTNGRRSWSESADVLCTGYGLVPNTEIARLLGCELRNDAVIVDDHQTTTVANVFAVGEVTGIGGAPLAITEGAIAGQAVASRALPSPDRLRRRNALRADARRMLAAFAPRDELRTLPGDGTTVCRCEDVTYGAVRGIACSRQAKLRTRVGMGPCQGRTCMPGLQFLLGWESDTVRPPVEPTLMSVLSSEIMDDVTASSSINHSVGDTTR